VRSISDGHDELELGIGSSSPVNQFTAARTFMNSS